MNFAEELYMISKKNNPLCQDVLKLVAKIKEICRQAAGNGQNYVVINCDEQMKLNARELCQRLRELGLEVIYKNGMLSQRLVIEW